MSLRATDVPTAPEHPAQAYCLSGAWPVLDPSGDAPVLPEDLACIPVVEVRLDDGGAARDSATPVESAIGAAFRWAVAILGGHALPPARGGQFDVPALSWSGATDASGASLIRFFAAAPAAGELPGLVVYVFGAAHGEPVGRGRGHPDPLPARAPLPGLQPPPPPVAVRLIHPFLRGVAAIAWRPALPSVTPMLAATCRTGICLWTPLPQPDGGRPGTATPLTVSHARGWVMDFHRLPGHRPVTALAWSPCGTRLATGSPADRRVAMWDVPSGGGHQNAAPQTHASGVSGVALLRWSPNGAHLLSAAPRGSFRLWETEAWANQRWDTGGHVSDAAWSYDSRCCLLAIAGQPSLVAVYPLGGGASAQILPVDVPGDAGASVVELAFGGRGGSRLAVRLTTGDVILYVAHSEPLVGLVSAGRITGPNASRAIALAWSQGAAPLLSVRWDCGRITTREVL